MTRPRRRRLRLRKVLHESLRSPSQYMMFLYKRDILLVPSSSEGLHVDYKLDFIYGTYYLYPNIWLPTFLTPCVKTIKREDRVHSAEPCFVLPGNPFTYIFHDVLLVYYKTVHKVVALGHQDGQRHSRTLVAVPSL